MNGIVGYLSHKTACCLLALLLLLVASQQPAATALATGDSSQAAAAVTDLGAEIDAIFAKHQEANRVPGAALVVVQNDRIALLTGYGFADLEQMRPVDPERTAWRVASVSKTLTIAAVLQLCDSRQINLDDDVSHYLNWEIKNPFPEPVRVRHLLSHTDGFGTRDINTFTTDASALRPLSDLLQAELTPPVKHPGTTVVYGSFGTALAGHLLERVSGLSFADHLDRYLLQPLGMRQSSFQQVLPPRLAADTATVYTFSDREQHYHPSPYLYLHTPPSGGLTTTAADMGRLLLALLRGGNPILSQQSNAAMLQQQFSQHPDLPGITYGFMEQPLGGERILIRDGSGLGVRSQICLLPEQNMGYFYVQNAGGDGLLKEFQRAFLQRFVAQPDSVAASLQPLDLRRYSGLYRAAASNEYTLVKFLEYLFTGNLRVTATETSLTVTPLGLGDYLGGFEGVSHWAAVAPSLLREIGQERYLAFLEDDVGRVTGLASGSGYHSTYDKLRWHESPTIQLALLLAMLLSFLSAPLLLLKLRRVGAPIPGWVWLGLAVSLLHLAGFCGTVYTLLLRRVAGFPAFGAGISPAAQVMLLLLHLGAVLTLPLLAYLPYLWRKRNYPPALRLYCAALAMAATGFLLWLNYWNLLGFRY